MSATRYKLRDYQAKAVDSIIDAIHCRPILVAPTGSGKTFIAVHIIERFAAAKTLWLTHREELIQQAAGELRAIGIQVGIIKSGYPERPAAKVQVCSIPTLVRREPTPGVGLIVVDEAAHSMSRTWSDVLAAYDVPLIGLTATPFRLDGKGLGDIFGKIIVAAYVDELVADGTLHNPRVFAPSAPNLKGVRVRMGDYAKDQLENAVNTDRLKADIVNTWLERAAGTKTICFAVTVKHSKDIVAAFQDTGVKAEHIDGTFSKSDRSEVLARWRAGEIDIVSNVFLLTEGFDLPALETAIIARPTASLNLHLQMLGRIMRTCAEKNTATVLDHAGNHLVHGFVTRRLEYSLDGKVGESEPLGLRMCPECYALYPVTLDSCPECGMAVVKCIRVDTAGVHNKGSLALMPEVDTFEYRAMIFNTLQAQQVAAGYKSGWTAYRYKEQFEDWPVVIGGELVDTKKPTMAQKEAVYMELIDKAVKKGFKRGWASHAYKRMFGYFPKGFVKKATKIYMREKWSHVPEK